MKVHIFDWGRSELNTVSHHETLTEEERHDRDKYWKYYVGGVDRLAWEATRAYRNRFGNVEDWASAEVILYDFDSTKYDDFLGKVEFPLEPVGKKTVMLQPGKSVLGREIGGGASLTFSVARRELPATSRLKSSWRVCIHSASDLPACDTAVSKSDPYVVLIAKSASGNMRFRQQSAVKQSELHPKWEETFDISVAVGGAALSAALAPGEKRPRNAGRGEISAAPASADAPAIPGLPPPLDTGLSGAEKDEEAHLLEWESYLDELAGTCVGVRRVRGGKSALSDLTTAASRPVEAATTLMGRLSTTASSMFGAMAGRSPRPSDLV